MESDGEGKGCTFYIDIPISKIDRGSNYRHTSPAHKDISSKVDWRIMCSVHIFCEGVYARYVQIKFTHFSNTTTSLQFKYTSPDTSPSSRDRRRKSSSAQSSPAHLTMSPVPSYATTVNNHHLNLHSGNIGASYYPGNSGNNSVNGSVNGNPYSAMNNNLASPQGMSRTRSDSHEVPQLNTPHGNIINNSSFLQRAFISPDSYSERDSSQAVGLSLQVPVGGSSNDSLGGFSANNSVADGTQVAANSSSSAYNRVGMYNADAIGASTREMNASIQAATSALNVTSTSQSGSTMTTDTSTTANDRSPHQFMHNRSGSSHNNSLYSLHSAASTHVQQQHQHQHQQILQQPFPTGAGAFVDAPNVHTAQLMAHHPAQSQAVLLTDHLSLSQRPPAGPSGGSNAVYNNGYNINPTMGQPAAFARGGSDQSIFTGGSSNRSNRSNHTRGSTSHSSFSSENDGMSSRTDLHEDGSMRIINLPSSMIFPDIPSRKLATLNDENTNIANANNNSNMSILQSNKLNNGSTGYLRVGTILEGEKEGENEKSSESGENEKSGDSGAYLHVANSIHNDAAHNSGDHRQTVLDRLNTQQIQEMQLQQQQQQQYEYQNQGQPSQQHYQNNQLPQQTFQPQSSQQSQPPPVQSSSLIFHKRALIVDDSAINRKFVNRLLRTKIGSRDEAEDGLQAVQMVQKSMQDGSGGYDVILMDYVMPVMDGPTATEKIRYVCAKLYVFHILLVHSSYFIFHIVTSVSRTFSLL